MRDANRQLEPDVELEIQLARRFERLPLLPAGKQQLFSSAMSVKRDLFLMTPETSGRVFQKYTSVNGSQWESQMCVCHMTKLRAGATPRLWMNWIARR